MSTRAGATTTTTRTRTRARRRKRIGLSVLLFGVCLLVCLFVCLFVCGFVCLFVGFCLLLCLFAFMSLCLVLSRPLCLNNTLGLSVFFVGVYLLFLVWKFEKLWRCNGIELLGLLFVYFLWACLFACMPRLYVSLSVCLYCLYVLMLFLHACMFAGLFVCLWVCLSALCLSAPCLFVLLCCVLFWNLALDVLAIQVIYSVCAWFTWVIWCLHTCSFLQNKKCFVEGEKHGLKEGAPIVEN